MTFWDWWLASEHAPFARQDQSCGTVYDVRDGRYKTWTAVDLPSDGPL